MTKSICKQYHNAGGKAQKIKETSVASVKRLVNSYTLVKQHLKNVLKR